MIVCQKKPIEMMNKKSAFIFILFANIIILAHGFVPHRHAINQVFIISHHHKHAATNHNHERDNKNDKIYCLLSQIVGIRANTDKQICNQDDYGDIDSNLGWLPVILSDYNYNCNLVSVSMYLLIPPINFTYTSNAMCVLGLRAPPSI